ncbi:MAG: outer rane efflux protein [Myxococcaceae bacterium]|jgi:outer membrane protein|nr:outer rane efflux protein [Myxococcaceae bacterium]MEA2748089.1 outer membrane protein [Myxococcales bacterium]
MLALVFPIFMQVTANTANAPASLPATPPPAEAPPPPTTSSGTPVRVVRLQDAVDLALKNQPAMQGARAQTRAAEGRKTQARSGFFPQVTAVASYQRVKGRAGTATTPVGGTATAVPNTDTSPFDVYTVGGTVTQLIWDWGSTYNRSRAAGRLVDSFVAAEKVSSQNIVVDVRRSYFLARAQKALVGVARDSLANVVKHLVQIQGFVSVGTRPEIDLAQARTDVASNRLLLINAENAYAVARTQLGRAVGLPDQGEFDVADDELPPVEGEGLATERLVAQAVAARPELAVFEKQREADELLAKGFRGNYGPTLSASGSLSETGTDIANLGPAWSVGVNLTWPIFQGGLTHGQVREAEANADVVRAQSDLEKVSIRVEVQQAQLGIRAAKESQIASSEVLANARERLRLAEGRYSAGVGSIIELGDAQLTVSNAAAQVVQAQFQLSSARADLLAALGQR